MRINRSGLTSKCQTPKKLLRAKRKWSPFPWLPYSHIQPKFGDRIERSARYEVVFDAAVDRAKNNVAAKPAPGYAEEPESAEAA